MKVYILTRGRVHHQPLYFQLSRVGFRPILVVDSDESREYFNEGYLTVECDTIGDIAAKRQFVLNRPGNDGKLVMMDDDIMLERELDIIEGFSKAYCLLEKFCHGGIHSRAFIHGVKKPFVTSGFYRQVSFYNTNLLPSDVKFNSNMNSCEDMDFFVQLLEQGMQYFVLTMINICDKFDKNLRSWFSDERKLELMEVIYKKHPDCVYTKRDGGKALRFSKLLKQNKISS